MLLELRAEEGRQVSWLALIGGIAGALAVLAQILYVIHNLKSAQQPFPPLARSTFDDVRNVGLLLFGSYNLPFQIIGILVLVATIGVVLLSKREPRYHGNACRLSPPHRHSFPAPIPLRD